MNLFRPSVKAILNLLPSESRQYYLNTRMPGPEFLGLLSCFIGMLTDSRSFLSFPRHEYFRRILCNLIGKDVHNGELPNDTKWLGGIVADICYNNAKKYFDFGLDS